MAQVKWTPDASGDLAKIHQDIARDAPAAAPAFILRLLDSVARLHHFPGSGRVGAEFGTESLRQNIVGSYRIVYRLRGDEVEIVRVRHGARLLSTTDLPFEEQ